MKKSEITVVVVTYNSEINDILLTIRSILSQKNIILKLIISDDGSYDNKLTELKKYFKEIGYENVTYIMNENNMGTVANALSALNHVETEYVKMIGPGDFFFNDYVLSNYLKILKDENLDILFGNAVYYIDEENDRKVFSSYARPYYKKSYLECRNLEKVCVEYGDLPHGAASVGKAYIYKKYIEMLQGHVKYAEDLALKLMILDKCKFKYIDDSFVLYQYGTGVSTIKDTKWVNRMREDEIGTNHLIIDYLQRNDSKKNMKLIATVKQIIKISETNNKLYKFILYLKIPGRLFSKAQQKTFRRYTSNISPTREDNELFWKGK